jgi:uroporphyrinogen-III synthase
MKSKKVVVTRAAHQASELAALLEARRAVPVLYPCIAIVPPEDPQALDEGIRRAADGGFDWIVFTSANTVFAVASRLRTLGVQPEQLGKSAVAAIGPATARAVEAALDLPAETVAEDYTSESLSLFLSPARGARIFLPQSDIARPFLRESLAADGAEVCAAPAYRTVTGSGGADVPRLLETNEVDAVTFTSSSSAENFVKRMAAEGGSLIHLAPVCVACLGSKTAETAGALGIPVTEVARENTLEGLVALLERRLSG